MSSYRNLNNDLSGLKEPGLQLKVMLMLILLFSALMLVPDVA